MTEMVTQTIGMFREDGSRVQLHDVLHDIDGEGLVWSILFYYGIGAAPNGMAMPDFESLVKGKPTGLIMSWSDLVTFSKNLEQTIDCLIVAVRSSDDLISEELSCDDFSRCVSVVEARDSTDWAISHR